MNIRVRQTAGAHRDVAGNGRRVIAMYFVVAYVGPFVAQEIFGAELESVYWKGPVTPYGVLLGPVTFALFLFFGRYVLPPSPGKSAGTTVGLLSVVGQLYGKLRLPFSIGALLLAAAYFSSGYNAYRYAEYGISERGSPFLLTMNVLNVVIAVDLLRMLFVVPTHEAKDTRLRVESLLLALAYCLSASGATGVFIGVASLFCVLAPETYAKLMFLPRRLPVWTMIRRGAISVALVVAIFGAAWLANEGIKASSRGAAKVLTGATNTALSVSANEDWLVVYLYYLMERTSIYYYSLLLTANGVEDASTVGGGHPLLLPLRTLAFRADYLLLGGLLRIEKPAVPSMMRLNFLLLSRDPARFPRGGSAPGVLAAFNYALPFPINILGCALYLAWMGRLVDVILWRRRRQVVSLAGVLLLLLFCGNFLASPFDLIDFIDSGGIHVVLMYALYKVERSRWWRDSGEVSPQPYCPQEA